MRWWTPRVRKILLGIVVFETAFILFWLSAAMLWYSSYVSLRSGQFTRATQLQTIAKPFFFVSKTLYSLSRLPLVVVHISAGPDRLMRISTQVEQLADAGTHAAETTNASIPIVLKRDKTAGDIILLRQNIAELKKQLPQIDDAMKVLATELPKTRLPKLQPYTSLLRAMIMDEDEVFGVHKPARYLLLFLNNKELRPGGGFIGSYAVATIQYYTLLDVEIHDVYTADGQLKVHIDPDPAVAKYLEQPDGFLRDSNFSPDFPTDAELAKRYLLESLGERNFEGVIGVTTTALEYAVGAYGSVYLPDYKETVTQSNVYTKTQNYVEKDFFPGSQAKKTFLTSLANTMRITYDTVPTNRLFQAFEKALLGKHIIASVGAPHVSAVLKDQGWDGSQWIPAYDYVMPVEANVGVNKSNYFVKRRMDMISDISNPKKPKRTVRMTYENARRQDTDPKDTYKMFFQLYLPPNVTIEESTVDGKPPVDYDVTDKNGYRIVSMLVEVPPLKSKSISIKYFSEEPQNKGDAYALRIQKQIGVDQTEVSHTYIRPDRETPAIAQVRSPRVSQSFSLLNDRTLTFDE